MLLDARFDEADVGRKDMVCQKTIIDLGLTKDFVDALDISVLDSS